MSDLELAGTMVEFALMEMFYPWPWWTPIAVALAGAAAIAVGIMIYRRRRRPAGTALFQQRKPRA